MSSESGRMRSGNRLRNFPVRLKTCSRRRFPWQRQRFVCFCHPTFDCRKLIRQTEWQSRTLEHTRTHTHSTIAERLTVPFVILAVLDFERNVGAGTGPGKSWHRFTVWVNFCWVAKIGLISVRFIEKVTNSFPVVVWLVWSLE